MLLISFIFFFIGISYSRPRSAALNDELNIAEKMNNMKPFIANNKAGVNANATCLPTIFTNSTGNPMTGPSWGGQLLIVSLLNVNSYPLTNIAFFVTQITSPASSPVDIVIYNSTSSNVPDTLVNKIPAVDLNTFGANQFSCLPLNQGKELIKLSPGVYWVGFYNPGTVSSVIPRVPTTNGGINYNYKYVGGSPTIGSNFPSGYSSENNQLVMGFSPSTCNSLSCNSCTSNSNCVWCLSSASCIGTPQIPTCRSWTRNPGTCDACAEYNSCNTCVSQDSCAWCITNGQPSACLQEKNDGNCSTAITEPKFCSV